VNTEDYIEQICEDLKNALADLDSNKDDESYKRVRCIVRSIRQLTDGLINE